MLNLFLVSLGHKGRSHCCSCSNMACRLYQSASQYLPELVAFAALLLLTFKTFWRKSDLTEDCYPRRKLLSFLASLVKFSLRGSVWELEGCTKEVWYAFDEKWWPCVRSNWFRLWDHKFQSTKCGVGHLGNCRGSGKWHCRGIVCYKIHIRTQCRCRSRYEHRSQSWPYDSIIPSGL